MKITCRHNRTNNDSNNLIEKICQTYKWKHQHSVNKKYNLIHRCVCSMFILNRTRRVLVFFLVTKSGTENILRTERKYLEQTKRERKQLVAIGYLNFPYFVIVMPRMCASCTIRHPFLWQVYSVSAFRIPAGAAMLANQVLGWHLVDSGE